MMLMWIFVICPMLNVKLPFGTIDIFKLNVHLSVEMFKKYFTEMFEFKFQINQLETFLHLK